MDNVVQQLSEAIREAAAQKRPLCIRGGGTKDFYGGAMRGDVLDTAAYRGIVDYEPTELVITARAGTPLAEIEAALREKGQMLAFEPPHFGDGATLGGCVAAGLSGPRRAYAGAVRDFVLGVRMLDGKGDDLRFGGQVMKNVAGYDVSRLMAGSLGTLGVLLEVSLKVLAAAASETTLHLKRGRGGSHLAHERMGRQAAADHGDGVSRRRPRRAALRRARRGRRRGEEDSAAPWWTRPRPSGSGPASASRPTRSSRASAPLWRLSVKPTTPPLGLPGGQLIEWGGALRWLKSDADAKTIRDAAARAGGHATLFRGGDKSAGVFQPLAPALMKLHRNLKRAFDPAGILNPGRLYPDSMKSVNGEW